MAERITEAQFLATQADLARAEMGNSLHHLAHEVTDRVGPRKWIRRHPWTSLAAAAGTGAGLGYILISKRNHAQQTPTWVGPTANDAPSAKPRGSGLSRLILLPLFASLGQAAKVALDRFLIGLVESMLATASTAEPDVASSEADVPEQEVPAAV